MPAPSPLAKVRRSIVPAPLRGKPIRLVQRAIAQRTHHYPHRNLLIIGQPKSGSTWLLRMVLEVPGYQKWAPQTVKLGLPHDLREEDFVPPPVGYTVTKPHTMATLENVSVVRTTGRPFVVLIRDPRDLAVSWAYYVGLPGRKRWGWPEAVGLSVEERISFYIERVLPKQSRWGLDWKRAIEDELPEGQGLMVRYEDMLADVRGVMERVFAHFGVEMPDARLREICEKHGFRKATGRAPGEGDPKSFNRKGIAGDWKNHFTPEQVAAFKSQAGERLIELGYASDLGW
ncbi:MAG: sulfotransferase domain-containing protein [Planctomycetota bacterium]